MARTLTWINADTVELKEHHVSGEDDSGSWTLTPLAQALVLVPDLVRFLEGVPDGQQPVVRVHYERGGQDDGD